jgi:dihydrolipoamide dehydrogenase
MENFDVTVIGSGPGGYVSAIRCAQLGFKTALIEKYSTLGGTCLNVGCIPSKALLDSSEHFYQANHQFEAHGIQASNIKLDFKKMIERKNQVVNQTCDGVNFLMKKNNITVFEGLGHFLNDHEIGIKDEKGKVQKISSKNIIIATGSKPSDLPFAKIDKKRIISSTEALSLDKLPKSMIIVGGGVIGLELGSVYQRLGTEVTVIEYLEMILPGMDGDIRKEMQRILKKQGLKINVKHAVTEIKSTKNNVSVKAKDKLGKEVIFKADYCMLAVGRKPFTEGLKLEAAGIEKNEKGQIQVNENLQTSKSHIFAIGDVIDGPMLAHKAEEDGIYVAELIANQKPHLNYHLVPGVVYTWPEVASVGFTEEELKKEGLEYNKGSFPFRASGRARASMDIDGFIKVLTDKQSDEILGVHMIGPRTADMISEAVIAMEYKATGEDIARICHAHPTFTEAIKEACLAASGDRALHM